VGSKSYAAILSNIDNLKFEILSHQTILRDTVRPVQLYFQENMQLILIKRPLNFQHPVIFFKNLNNFECLPPASKLQD